MSRHTSSPDRALPRRSTTAWLALSAAVVTVLSAALAVVNASPPDHQPPANATYDLHVPAGGVPCGPITITFTDHERYTTFSSGLTLVTGRLTAVVTSDITGKSVNLNVASSVDGRSKPTLMACCPIANSRWRYW